jgi:hypothetical protein
MENAHRVSVGVSIEHVVPSRSESSTSGLAESS